MSGLNVLIVGASIAGPTAAYWFAKAGANVTVIERFPSLRTGGQNVDIRTAGVTVMRKMTGMEEAVKAKVLPLEGICFVGKDGKPIATMKSTGDVERQSLVSEFEIFRGDLAKVICDLTEGNERVKYVFGEQIASMQSKDDGPIFVEFQNGYPTATYDLVVACDGATSRTRAMGLGCGVRDHIRPLNAWASYFSISENIIGDTMIGHAHSAVGGRFIAAGPDPTGVTRVTLMSIHPKNDPNATLPFREAQKQGTEALKDHVAERFRGSGWKIDEMTQGMMKSDDFYASEMVQVKVPTVYKGRFVMVGDAGYASGPTGGGTSLAIAGGYILAGEICQHPGDIEGGLKAYAERMKPIITDMQVIPPGVPGIMAPQTAWGIWFRNVVFRVICWGMAASSLFTWLGGFWASSFGEDKYGLPDYDWVA